MSAYLPHTERDVAAMLAAIGVPSIDALFSQIPPGLRERARLDLPAGLTEPELRARLGALAARNPQMVVFCGAGIYPHDAPAVVDHILQRSEFATAYTPGGDMTGAFRAGMELGRYKNERADRARKQQTLADIIRNAKSEEEAVKMAASTGDTEVQNGVAAFIAKSDAASRISSDRALSEILANSIDIRQTPGVQQATAVDDEGNVNPMVEPPRTEANLSWDKAFANLAQTDPRIRGKMALQLQKMRMDEEQARLKAVKESRIGLDYEDIKVRSRSDRRPLAVSETT